MIRTRQTIPTLHVGQRVMTPLGTATIIGFESFTPHGKQGPTMDVDNGGRAIVKLDDPSLWIGTSERSPHPYIFRSQLSELNET